MGRALFTPRTLAAIGVSLLLAACTTHDQKTPSLTGPSGLGTSLVITVSPDVLNQDGASQSLVQIQAYDSNGQPQRNVSMRVEIMVEGVVTDFGSLSAKNVVTDSSGRASVTYTAPPAPPVSTLGDTVVQIGVTPATSDNANATKRTVNIRLTPPGVVGPPRSPLQVDFTQAGTTSQGDNASFTAVVTEAGKSALDQVARFDWSFSDGGRATGETVTHTFLKVGSTSITLTITDRLGRTTSVTKSVTVSGGSPIQVTFVHSPDSPTAQKSVFFNAAVIQVPVGRSITNYDWDFGDGTGHGSGIAPSHVYATDGGYHVVLSVTDNFGNTWVGDQLITIGGGSGGGGGGGGGSLSANFTWTNTGLTYTFSDASSGTPVQWQWNIGPNNYQVGGRTIVYSFPQPGNYNVTLVVSDADGNTKSVTKTVLVS